MSERIAAGSTCRCFERTNLDASGAFPSVFVQAVWVAVDLEQNLMLGGLLKEKSLGNRREKRRSPYIKPQKKTI
jgi:hypothetical protein